MSARDERPAPETHVERTTVVVRNGVAHERSVTRGGDRPPRTTARDEPLDDR